MLLSLTLTTLPIAEPGDILDLSELGSPVVNPIIRPSLPVETIKKPIIGEPIIIEPIVRPIDLSYRKKKSIFEGAMENNMMIVMVIIIDLLQQEVVFILIAKLQWKQLEMRMLAILLSTQSQKAISQ